jgi:hypothetical protein
MSRSTTCANNQRQIILSAMVYANDNNQLWPCRPTDAQGNATTDPTRIDGFCTAAASLEMLMVRNTDLPLKIFLCPSNTGTFNYLSPPYDNLMAYDHGVSQWGRNHWPATAGGPGAMAYAYDWSAPSSASAVRVMMTDRGNLSCAHKQYIMVAAGDGHVVKIAIAPATQRTLNDLVTLDLNGTGETASFPAKDSSPTPTDQDDVYDDHGDDGAMNRPGLGSSTRCWVR